MFYFASQCHFQKTIIKNIHYRRLTISTQLLARTKQTTYFSFTSSTTNTRPQTFLQTVQQSDGSTFTIRTCSPRPLLTLTKDTCNHVLWNPENYVLEEGSAELAKFKSKYGESLLEESQIIDTQVGGFQFSVLAQEKKVVIKEVIAVKPKGKGKK